MFLAEEMKRKSSKLLDKVNSIMLDTSDENIKNNFNNKSSQKHLLKLREKVGNMSLIIKVISILVLIKELFSCFVRHVVNVSLLSEMI